MRLIDQCTDRKIHTRNISIATYNCSENSIVVEGILKDDRQISYFVPEQDAIPPGTVHHMIVRMRIQGPSLTIANVEVEMPATPHADCIDLKNSLDRLVGLRIVPGFTSRVKKAIGGVKGCVHLTTLVLAMAPAAVQGYWTHRGSRPSDDPISTEAVEQYLINTCRVWRRNGPLAQKVLART